ncbi:MAG: hypothetical protein AVDCRST_MAG19-4888 [uncultured Thermomicrobiales bacterium]|uniref:Uncharacterized protein n=1 Tax=uncultured Thermomicrobiales bacterium TaxID=1645740 RepID=A0A6J4VR71_9BACT|nr:MAG: hypothetical protein AVDCRST_MAG19-4888 [uncultured Thermomicrobiales bacterium]
MTEQFKASTIRALYGAMSIGFSTVLGAYQALSAILAGSETPMPKGDRWEASLVAGGVSFFGYMIAPGAAEGLIDSNRGPSSADVGQPKA